VASSTFVMFRRSNAPGLYDAIMRVWKAAGLKPKILEDTMRMPTILSLVAVERGVSLVPRAAAGLGRQGVVFRPVRPPLPTVEMGVAYRRAEASPTVWAFLDMVGAVYRKQLPRQRLAQRSTGCGPPTRRHRDCPSAPGSRRRDCGRQTYVQPARRLTRTASS
jgi:LysR substrate binding domain